MRHPQIDVMAANGSWPLWVADRQTSRRSTDPAQLALPVPLVADLLAWSYEFDQRDPVRCGFPDRDAEDEFWMRGRVLAGRIAVAVAGQYHVQYFDGRYGALSPVLPDGGTRLDAGRAILPSHWQDVSGTPEVRDGLSAELCRELPAGHVLAGRRTDVVARCRRCDDVLIPVDDDAYAVVHLTWKRETDANWPRVEVHTDAGALLADLSERHA
jgi:hypothetical protein